MTVSRYSPPGTAPFIRGGKRIARVPMGMVEHLGHQLTFVWQVLVAIPHTLRS